MIDLKLIGGFFDKTMDFLHRTTDSSFEEILRRGGQAGVDALAAATPFDTGLAASSWGYELSGSNGQYQIAWTNSDVESGFDVVMMLQYGYGTGTGGYVEGRDFINPAMGPVFDQILADIIEEVQR